MRSAQMTVSVLPRESTGESYHEFSLKYFYSDIFASYDNIRILDHSGSFAPDTRRNPARTDPSGKRPDTGKTMTNRRSRTVLITAEMIRKMRGRRESPTARRIPVPML